MKEETNNKKATIVILSNVNNDNSPYCIFVHEHAKALVKLGYNVITIATINWFPFINFLKKDRKKYYEGKKGTKEIDGVTIVYKKRLSFSNFLYDSKINLNGISYYLTIKKIIKKISKTNKILFIDAHTFKEEGYAAALLHKKFGYKAVVTCHGTSLIKTTKCKNSNSIVSNIMKNVNYAICVSDSLEIRLKNLGYSNTKVIYNGINFYSTKKNESRDISILTVATLIKQKNIDLIIKACKEIKNKFDNINLIIVGKGPELEYLKNLTNDLQLEERVKFVGQVNNEEVHRLMKKSEIFVLTSINEGFGIVYAEAMSNGCITIGTKGEGIDGFIKNGENGFLVQPKVEEIVKLIEEIYERKSNIEAIREKAYRDSKQLTWENNANEYIKLMEVTK